MSRDIEPISELLEAVHEEYDAKGVQLTIIGENLDSTSYSAAREREYNVYVAMAASVFLECVAAVDEEPKEFLRDVVNEYNRREKGVEGFGR